MSNRENDVKAYLVTHSFDRWKQCAQGISYLIQNTRLQKYAQWRNKFFVSWPVGCLLWQTCYHIL